MGIDGAHDGILTSSPEQYDTQLPQDGAAAHEGNEVMHPHVSTHPPVSPTAHHIGAESPHHASPKTNGPCGVIKNLFKRIPSLKKKTKNPK